VKGLYTFSPTRVAKVSDLMVENARKKHAEIKDKHNQEDEKEAHKEYTFQPRLLSNNKKNYEMVENSRKRALEFAIKKKMDLDIRENWNQSQDSKMDLKPAKKPKNITLGPQRIPVAKKI
jgi:hypothetical protein